MQAIRSRNITPILVKCGLSIAACAGGVRSTMYSELPKQVQSRFGFQGCLASLELNGIVIDPAKVKIVHFFSVGEYYGNSMAVCYT